MDSKIPINIDDSLSRHESIQARIDTRRRQQSSVPIKKKQKKIPLFTKHREGWKDAIEKAACNGWWHRSFGYGTSAHGCRPYPSLQRWHAHVKQRFRFRLSFSKVSSHGWLVENLAILMDGITSCATYYLEYYPVSAASKFSFFFLPILCYPRGSMVRFIVPNFSKNRVSMQAFLSKCAGNGMIYSSQGGFNWEEFRFWLV